MLYSCTRGLERVKDMACKATSLVSISYVRGGYLLQSVACGYDIIAFYHTCVYRLARMFVAADC